MTGAPPWISVVVPHYENPGGLRDCLAALAGQDAEGIPFEVLVVDNGSSEPPVALCAEFPETRLLLEPEPGPGHARTRGAAAARGAIVAFVDSDCCADPGWIAAIHRAFTDPTITVAGGDVHIRLADPRRMTMIEAYESVFGYRMRLYVERDGFAATCNMAVRRDVFEAVGPFAGIGVAEDMDWGRRASALGYRPHYIPAMRVETPARESFGELARKWDRHIAHAYAERCRPGDTIRWVGRAALLVASPLAEVPRILLSDRLARSGDRARAFLCVTWVRLHRARQMLRLVLGADPAQLSGAWRKPAHPVGRSPK